MRSFADYRKTSLRKNLPTVSVREGVDGILNILRLDLLEAIKLPQANIFEHSLIAESTYNRARKQDFEDNKRIVEFVVSHYRAHFYEELLAEAEAVAANPQANVQMELTTKIKELVQSLKDQVATILKGTRPTDAVGDEGDAGSGPVPSAAPTASSTSSAAPTPTASGSQGGAGGPSGPNISSAAGAATAAHAAAPTHGPAAAPSPTATGTTRPTDPNGFTPAPYGDLRPSDGYFSGLKRVVYDPIANFLKSSTRGLRRRWHNDPTREHTHYFETLFMENFDQVMGVIDSFETELIKYLSDKFGLISNDAATSPTTPPVTHNMPTKGAPGVMPVTPRGEEAASKQAAKVAADPESAQTGTPSEPEQQPLDAIPQDARAQEELSRIGSATKGAELLGISIGGLGARGGWGKVKPANFVGADKQPVAPGKLVGDVHEDAGWAKLRNQLFLMVYNKIAETDPQVIDNYKNLKRGRGMMAKIGKSDRRDVVQNWLKFQSTGSKNAVLDLLSAFYNKMTKVQSGDTTPPVDPSAVQSNAAKSVAQPPIGKAPTMPVKSAEASPKGTMPVTLRGQPSPQKTDAGKGNEVDDFIKNFSQNSPELWNRLLRHAQGNEDVLKRAIARHVTELGPEQAFNSLSQTAQGMPPVNPEQEETPEPTAHSAARSVEAPAMPSAPESQPQAAGTDLSAVKAQLDRLLSDEGLQEIWDMLDYKKLSDAELAKVVQGVDPNDISELANRVVDAVEKKEGGEGEAPQEAPQPVSASRGLPPEGDRLKSPVSANPVRELTRHPEYTKLMDKYMQLFQDNFDTDENEAMDSAVKLEDELKDMLMKGQSVDDAIARLKAAVQEEIKRGNDPATYNPLTMQAKGSGDKGKVDGAGDSLADTLQGMKPEGFGRIVNRFKQILRS